MILVTGGGGFLGGTIARMLLNRGERVRCLQRGAYPQLAADGAECVRGDLSDSQAVLEAATGCSAIIHTAAKAGVWGSFASYHQPNVAGTHNIITACQRYGIPHLVYTSTPSVAFSGRDEEGVDEHAPYCAKPLNAYQATKIEAEKAVLAANRNQLKTVALRPHLIWGPGDPHLVPRVLERAQAGKLKLVNGGRKLVDSTYIANAAHAHLLALDELRDGGHCAGRAYFISNGEPLPMADLLNRIIRAGGLPEVTATIGGRMAYSVSSMLEFTHRCLRLTREPLMTRFVARQLSTAHWYDLSAARHDLGYLPQVSIEEGMRRLQASLR